MKKSSNRASVTGTSSRASTRNSIAPRATLDETSSRASVRSPCTAASPIGASQKARSSRPDVQAPAPARASTMGSSMDASRRTSTSAEDQFEQPSIRRASTTGSSAPPSRASMRSQIPETAAQEALQSKKSAKLEKFAEESLRRIMTRKLSFVDCCIEQIQSAITAEDPNYPFNPHFWQVLLCEGPTSESLVLKNRTFTFWIKFYNTWQAMGDWKPGRAPKTINAFELRKLMPMTSTREKGVIKLFDPAGFKRVQYDGSTQAYEKVKIEVGPFLTAGVMLSECISSRHKLDFILGIVDINDNGKLEEPEFASFIQNFIAGLGAAFGLSGKSGMFPSAESIRLVAKSLYTRISKISSRRLHDMIAASHDPTVIQTIHNLAQSRLCRQASPEPIKSTTNQSDKSSSVKSVQLVHMGALREWCQSQCRDPLAVPYNLVIERFCPARQGNDVPDEYEDALMVFNVSHTEPLLLPETKEFQGQLLSRKEVEQAHILFQYCNEREGSVRLQDFEAGSGIKVAYAWRESFERALRQYNRAWPGKVTFFDFLRSLCPGAEPKHLRMFDTWLQDWIAINEAKQKLSKMDSMSNWFAEEIAKPELPADELRRIQREFKYIDTSGNGIVEVNELASAWGWSEEDTKAAIAQYDIMEDGCIDEQEFIRMMCPCQYQLPTEVGVKDAIAKLLKEGKIAHGEVLNTMQTKYNGEASVLNTPIDLKPEVDDATWNSWNRMYSDMDKNSDERVTLAELKLSGLFISRCSDANNCADCLLDVIARGEKHFSREDFLKAMLLVHGLRRIGIATDGILLGA